MVMMSQFLPMGRFKWIDPKKYGSNKYSSNSLKSCVLGVYLEYPKELRELRYPLTPDKIKSIFIIFLLVILKHSCLTFLIKKSVCFIMKTWNFI